MPQAERVAKFMQGDAVDIHVLTHLPVLVLIEVHVASQRFAVGRGGIKRVRQNLPGAIERVAVAMIPAAPKNPDRPGRRRVVSFDEIHLNHPGPFPEGTKHLGLLRRRGDLLSERPEGELKRSPPLAGAIPAISHGLHQRSDGAGLGGSARAADQRRAVHQFGARRKDVGDLIPAHERLELRDGAAHEHLVADKVRVIAQFEAGLLNQIAALLPGDVGMKLDDIAPAPHPAGADLAAELLGRFKRAGRDDVERPQAWLAVNSQDEAVDGHIRDDALPVALNRPQQFRRRRLAQFNQIMRPLRLARLRFGPGDSPPFPSPLQAQGPLSLSPASKQQTCNHQANHLNFHILRISISAESFAARLPLTN